MLTCLGAKLKDDAIVVPVLQQTNAVDEELRCGWGLLCDGWPRYHTRWMNLSKKEKKEWMKGWDELSCH